MKVGILTFHEVYNPGAFLQALATQRLVESMGHSAKIIDYTPASHRHSLKRIMSGLSWRVPFKLGWIQQVHRKNLEFSKARKKWMNLTRRFETKEEVASEYFDCVLVGADVVWNYVIKQYGRDPIYFGRGLNTSELIAFAPSFGPCSVEDAPPSYVVEGLRKFRHLAVRDTNSQRIVENLIGIQPKIICDPAFHLDLDQLPKTCNQTQPFLLIYMLPQFVSKETISEIQEFAVKHHLRIIATLYPQKWAHENRIADGPMDWLGLMSKASFVVTNTFHGVVFCTKMEKRFAMQYTPLIRSKTTHMVEQLQIDDRIFENNRKLEEILMSDSSFDIARKRIADLTRDARLYLEHSIVGPHN